MDEQKIQQMIDDRVNKILGNIQNVSSIPFHLHNGIDSPQIPFRNLQTILRGQVTYNPGNLVDGAGVTTTITVPNAALGDSVIISFSLDLQGIILTGYVSSSNTVSVRFQNETTGAIDLASGNLSAIVIKI
jgi:hypothetical protein